jgi:hypothetical protein
MFANKLKNKADYGERSRQETMPMTRKVDGILIKFIL